MDAYIVALLLPLFVYFLFVIVKIILADFYCGMMRLSYWNAKKSYGIWPT